MSPSYLLRTCHEHSMENLTSATHSVLDTAIPLNKSLLLHRLLHPAILRVEGSGGRPEHQAQCRAVQTHSSRVSHWLHFLQRLHSPKLTELRALDRVQALGLVG